MSAYQYPHARPVRPGFKPTTTEEYTVLRPVRVTRLVEVPAENEGDEPRIGRQNVTLTCGDTLKKGELPIHVLRWHYNQRKLGPKGHPWTEYQLYINACKVAQSKGEESPEPPEWLQDIWSKQSASRQVLAGIKATAVTGEDGSTDATPPLANKDLEALTALQGQHTAAKHVGGGYYEVTVGYETHRVKGKDAVRELGVEVD